MCPVLIPLLITFASKRNKKDAEENVEENAENGAANENTKRQLYHMHNLRNRIRAVRLFYKAPVVKFCCHTVIMQFARTDSAAF